MRTIIVLTIIIMLEKVSANKLIGDHVCHEEKTYKVNVTEYFTRNLTVRNYKWCINVPPRCSYYTVKIVNDSQIIEREVTDTIEKCCPGFVEDNNKCSPQCGECYEGYCDGDQCFCKSGYQGKSCNFVCDETHWGPNCVYNCTCQRGRCNSKTGNCVCPSGWTGVDCNIPCKDGFFGKNCSEICSCNIYEKCNAVDGSCESKVSSTTSTTTMKIEETTNYLNFSTISETTTKLSDNFTKIPVNSNGKFKTYVTEKGILTVNHDILYNNDSSTVGKEFDKYDAKEVEVFEIPTLNNNISISSSKIMKSSKAKVNHIQLSVTSESSLNYQKKEDANYMNDEIIKGNKKNDNGLIYTVSAIFVVSIIVIIFSVVIIFIQHFKRTEKKLKGNTQVRGNKGVPSVSVYTTSIFHTPLPEPPIIENPIFSPPTTNEVVETKIVCSLNFPNSKELNAKEYLYDHPPSTGSYRAASIPEPPEQYQLSMQCIPEPLYDEIPSRIIPPAVTQPLPSYKSLSLYMNTCGKTHF